MNTPNTIPAGESLPDCMIEHQGYYWVRRMVDGRRKKIPTGCRVDDYRAAKTAHRRIMADIDSGKGIDKPKDSRLTFKQWWAHYKATYTVTKASPDSDTRAAHYAMEELGGRRIVDIRQSHCQRVLNDMTRKHGLSASTARLYACQLTTMFNAAVIDTLITTNPWAGIAKGAPKENSTIVLSHEHQAMLTKELTPYWRRWMICLLGTGMRFEELQHVTPADVNATTELAHVRKPKGLNRKKHPAKMRHVWTPPVVLGAFSEQIADKSKRGKGGRPSKLKGSIFPATNCCASRVLKEACDMLEIPKVHPHMLRHTFATRYLQGGGDIFILSKILGHSTVRETQRVYAHVLKEDLVARSRGIDLGLGRI